MTKKMVGGRRETRTRILILRLGKKKIWRKKKAAGTCDMRNLSRKGGDRTRKKRRLQRCDTKKWEWIQLRMWVCQIIALLQDQEMLS